MILTIFIWLTCAACYFIANHFLRSYRRLDKYEFEHRSSGGAVEFRTYEESISHRHKIAQAKQWGLFFGMMAIMSGGIGVINLLYILL